MARKDGRRENQHYVPKLILRNFCAEPAKRGSEKIWVFNKPDSSTFRTNIRNVAAESAFYDIHGDDSENGMEEILSNLEHHATQAVSQIVQERTLTSLSQEARAWLAVFCAVQFVRGPHFREMDAMMDAAIQKKINESGGDINKVKGYRPRSASEAKNSVVSFISVAAQDFAPYFAQKACLLLETIQTNPFFISDNPIALYNQIDLSPHGNLGLAVPGIEIYFPLTPTLTLVFWDPSLADLLAADLAKKKALRSQVRNYGSASFDPASLTDAAKEAADIDLRLEETEKLLDAARTGGVAKCEGKVVMFLNSLQVVNASRFVMPASRDFSLATQMLTEKPHLRSPPMLETN